LDKPLGELQRRYGPGGVEKNRFLPAENQTQAALPVSIKDVPKRTLKLKKLL
jgi:hypothetical protein